MALKQLNYEQRLYISTGARVICNNGVELDKPIIEWSIDLWAILPTILLFVVLGQRLATVARSVRYWVNDYHLRLKVFNYIIGLAIGEIVWQSLT